MINDDSEVEAWLVDCKNIIRDDIGFQFHWKLVVARLCYELALEGDWLGFVQASMQYDDPQFKLALK